MTSHSNGTVTDQQRKVVFVKNNLQYSVHTKEYISVIEGIEGYSVRWAGSEVYCRQSEERLGESNLCKTMAGAVPSITDMYSLVHTMVYPPLYKPLLE